MNLPFVFPIEIWQIILEKTEFIQQIRLRQVCKYFYNELYVTDFAFKIPCKYKRLLSDDILKQHKYIKYLDISLPTSGTDNGVYELYNLPANIVSDDGIKHLTSLTKLYADNNKYITDVNHLINLEELSIGGIYCGVNNEGIKNLLKIKVLDISDSNVSKINHLKNLEILIVCGYVYGGCCGSLSNFDSDDLLDLNLTELYISGNNKIIKIPYMINLRLIDIGDYFNCNISNNDIDFFRSIGVEI